MRFEYIAYSVQTTPTIPDGVVYRPELTVRLIGPRGEFVVSALIDTGADETVLPRSMANILGVVPDDELAGHAQGVTGQFMSIAPGEIKIEIVGADFAYRWTTLVNFADFPNSEDECVILGHIGALEFFVIEFDGGNRAGTIRPSDRYRGAVHNDTGSE